MEKFNQLLETLNGLQITQKHLEWEECIPDDIYKEHFSDYEDLEDGLYVDTRRWYETSVSVIKIYDKIMGIKHISNLFSEQSSCEDICHHLEFFEMEEIVKTSYKKK